MVKEKRIYISNYDENITFPTKKEAEKFEKDYGMFYQLLNKLKDLDEEYDSDDKWLDESFKKKVENLFKEAKDAFLNYMNEKHYIKEDKKALAEKCILDPEGLRHLAITYEYAIDEKIGVIGRVFSLIDYLYFEDNTMAKKKKMVFGR